MDHAFDRLQSSRLIQRFPILMPMLFAACVIALFALGRWIVAAHGDISRWVVAGDQFADPARVPHSLFVFPHSSGYDGEFYWRLAADPTNLHMGRHLGVTLDVPVRLNRPGYPLAAWLLAGGHRAYVPFGLVLANFVALIGLARLGVSAARERGLAAWWGLSLLAVPGLVGAFSRDLTEVVSTTLVVAGVLAMRRRQWIWAALAWSVAVLSRETSVIIVGAYGAVAIYEVVRRQRKPDGSDLGWAVPLLAMAVWQAAMGAVLGRYPLFASSDANLGAPIVGLVRAVPGWFSPGGLTQAAKGGVLVVQLVAAAILVALALAGRRRRARPAEWLSCVLATAVVLLGSTNPWKANFDLRLATDAMALAWLLLLDTANLRRLRQALAVNVPVLAGTLAARMAVI